MKTLSSNATFFSIWLIPPMCNVFTAYLFLKVEDPVNINWLHVGICFVLNIYVWWNPGRFKRVRMDDKFLYISNYLWEIQVPLSELKKVEEQWLKGKYVTLRFDRKMGLTNFVDFLPKFSWKGLFDQHPVIKEIREAAKKES